MAANTNADSTAAAVQKLRDTGRLGAVLAASPPQMRKRIHELDRRNGKGSN